MGEGTKRNKPCTCGSGQKFKRCCEGRKPVSETVTVDFGKPTEINGFRAGANGKVEFLYDGKVQTPERAWTGTHRERPKGEKHLTRVPLSPERLQLGEIPALQKYDRVFAIDANTKEIYGQTVSVACFVECLFVSKTNALIIPRGAYEYHNCQEQNHENFGWHLLISSLKMSLDFHDGLKIAIVTDSDLGNHSDYNERVKPYFKKHLLPKSFELLYSFDKGKSLGNKLIGACDKLANKMLMRIENHELDHINGLLVKNGWCTHFRAFCSVEDALHRDNRFRLGRAPGLEELSA